MQHKKLRVKSEEQGGQEREEKKINMGQTMTADATEKGENPRRKGEKTKNSMTL